MRRFGAFQITAVLACITFVMAITPDVYAQDDEVANLEEQAAAAYQAGDYKKAISLMVRANQLNPHPNYLLNIAVSYSKVGDCDNATLWATNAADAKDPALPQEGIEMAQSVIAECKTKLADGEGNGDGKNPEDSPSDNAEPLPWMTYATYGALGLGGLLIVGSGLYDLSLSDDVDEVKRLQQLEGQEAAFEAKKDEVSSAQSTVLVGYVFGALLLAGGGALYYYENIHKAESDAPTARLTPWFTPDAAGVGIGGTF